MPTDNKALFFAIYSKIAPELQLPGLDVNVENVEDVYSLIQITTPDYRFNAALSLYSDSVHSEDAPDISTYRWEYMDCNTGSIVESDLDYQATAEEVIAFFKHTIETDDSVIKP